MSGTGERGDAPEFDLEDTAHVEEQGPDESGSDEDGADDLGEEPGEGDVDSEQDDDAAGDVRQAGQPAGEAVGGKPRSAATIAVQEAKRAAKAEREARERAEARLAEIERAAQGRQTEAEQRLEAERVALMAPEERTAYEVGKVRQETQRELGAIKYQMWDSADRTSFDGLCARNPAFESVREDVERQAEQMRRAGQAVPERKVLATYFIGQRAIERAQKGGKTRQAAKGRENVQRQTGKPTGGRSDVAPARERSGGNDAKARAERLSNMEI